MKSNTDKSKELLMQALMALPGDESLREARSYIRTALSKIEHVESKREKRTETETSHQRWWGGVRDGVKRLQEGINSPPTMFDPKKAINAIDNMIAEEKRKMAESQRKKDSNPNGDVQTFFG